MAQISPRLARTYFAEISANSAVPLDLDDLVHMVRLRQHGHVVIGDIAIGALPAAATASAPPALALYMSRSSVSRAVREALRRPAPSCCS
ncbi:hypothetical protein [Streptomyces atratus]